MVDKTVRVLSESIARSMNRRQFLKRAGQTTFFGLAALVAGHSLGGKALAARDNPPSCAPPGPYCNLNGINEPNGCRGGSCFQHLYNGQILQCRVYYQYYQAGCWTTHVAGGYWVCCDCECPLQGGGRRTCGCAQFSQTPVPRPDGPTGGGKS
jgi:hypothetical protein